MYNRRGEKEVIVKNAYKINKYCDLFRNDVYFFFSGQNGLKIFFNIVFFSLFYVIIINFFVLFS